MRLGRTFIGWSLSAAIAAGVGGGCAADNEKSEMQQRQEAALKDPFSYGPAAGAGSAAPNRPAGEPEVKKRDDSLKGEWDRFWNP